MLNHTSFDSGWVKENPSAVYTIQNTPHLTSAFEVDSTIYEWGNQIKEDMKAVKERMSEEEFNKHKENLWARIASLKLEEFYRIPD